MPYGYGYGRGFGFRGASPPWPYVGRGRGGLPRCGAYTAPPYGVEQAAQGYGDPVAPGAMPNDRQWSREEELNFLRDEANAVKSQLNEIEARIKGLESE